MPTPRFFFLTLAPLLTTAALVAAVPAGAAATCAKHTGTIATGRGGRVWHQGATLFGCIHNFAGSSQTKTRRLGPWTPGTKVVFDGNSDNPVAWTVRVNNSDRVWATDIWEGRRWLSGTRLIPSATSDGFEDGRVQRLLVHGPVVGWISTGGDVVMSSCQTLDADSTQAIGTLPADPTVRKQLFLVGTFTGVPASTLAASAQLTDAGGDGDEGGGAEDYHLTVAPGPGAARVGGSLVYTYPTNNRKLCGE